MPGYEHDDEHDDEHVSDGVNLLISILVRYPEIGTVSFEPHDNCIKLTFMLSDIPTKDEFSIARSLLLDSIDAYHMLEGEPLKTSEVQLNTYNQVAMLRIFRDIYTISKNEIALIIIILREQFKNRLIIDFNDTLLEEDLLLQEEVIEDMLANIKKYKTKHGLIGIREDGRVLVFNK